MRRLLLCASLLLLARAAGSVEPPSRPLRGLSAVHDDGASAPRLPAARLKNDAETSEPDLLVSFKGKDGAIEREGKFRVASGAQANYVAGGEIPKELPAKLGTTIEFKKQAFILNIVASDDGKGGAVGELQVEISGPQPPDPKSELHENPISTFQLQTRFHAALGKPLVLVEEPGRRLELTIERAP